MIGKAAIEDIQQMINLIWDSTAFFYRRCISLECEAFCESVIEMSTALLFEANGGKVFNIARALFVAQYSLEIQELHEAMTENYAYRLQDMKVKLAIETIEMTEPDTITEALRKEREESNQSLLLQV